MANIRKIHPGEFIKDSLEAMEMTSKEFSMRTGISERTLSAVLNGNGNITFDIAFKLASFFDNSITFWTNLQTQYDMYLKSQIIQDDLQSDYKLFKQIKNYLLEHGYINESDSKDDAIYKTRKLVGVNKLSLLTEKDSFVCLKEQHIQKENDPFVQNFWIALALNEARKMNGIPYDKKKLKSYIPEIRNMTVLPPNDFYPRLKDILIECGVSFVLLPHLSKSNIYGATKWFSDENVMLAVSNRSEKADLFWFTLFHEIAHLLMEHKRETLISFNGAHDEEADRLASEMLIRKQDWDEFIQKGIFTVASIKQFAKRINILPCVVLGRLQKEKLVPYGRLDKSFNVSYHIVKNNSN